VDTEHTGKDILQKGKLRQRITILPLDKITGHQISREKRARAAELVGADNVHTALELVGYDLTLKKAMEHVFGSTFICTTSDDAKRVCFDKDIRTTCVSLVGDQYQPAGTLSGGSSSNKGSILVKWTELIDLRQRIAHDEKQLRVEQDQLKELTRIETSVRDLTTKKELLTHEVCVIYIIHIFHNA
jgi:structural maintenance of chromosome 2